MTEVLEFSTVRIPPRERMASWRKVTGLSATAPEEDCFEGHFRAGAIGRIGIFAVSANRHRVSADPMQAHQDRRSAFKLLFQEAGSLRLEQEGRTVELPAGCWCLYDKALPYVTQSSDGSRQLGALIPHGLLSSGWFDVDPHRLAVFPASSGIGRVLHDSLWAAMSGLDSLSARSREGLGDTLCDLARLALLEQGGARSQPSSMLDLKERVRAHVERNLDDPDLGVAGIAHAMGCSKRYIHKAFNGGGATVSQMIWDLRLERCRRELQRSDIPGVSITEICYAWGFNDSHHFSRLFRKRFGLAPREFRMRSLARSLHT